MFASISSLGAVCCFMITILCYYNVKCFPSQAGLSSCARTVSSIAVLPWMFRFISASFHKTIGRTHPHTVDISSALTIAFIAFISIDCGPCLLNVKFANNNKETTWLEVCVNNYVQQIVQRGRYKYQRMKNISAVPGGGFCIRQIVAIIKRNNNGQKTHTQINGEQKNKKQSFDCQT